MQWPLCGILLWNSERMERPVRKARHRRHETRPQSTAAPLASLSFSKKLWSLHHRTFAPSVSSSWNALLLTLSLVNCFLVLYLKSKPKSLWACVEVHGHVSQWQQSVYFGCAGSLLLWGLFSGCGGWRLLSTVVLSLLTAAASLFAEHGLWGSRSCSSVVVAHGLQLLRGLWELPRPGIKPTSSTMAGRIFTTEPPGKPSSFWFLSMPLVINSARTINFLLLLTMRSPEP